MGSNPRSDTGHGLRVLVVEDHPDTAQSTAFLLGIWGHQVQVCADGRGCIPAAEAFRPDVILLDIGLPGADGYEVARQVRERLSGKRLWLVAVTGFGQDRDRQRSQEAGIDYHLLKPVDPELLKGTLERIRAAPGPSPLPRGGT